MLLCSFQANGRGSTGGPGGSTPASVCSRRKACTRSLAFPLLDTLGSAQNCSTRGTSSASAAPRMSVGSEERQPSTHSCVATNPCLPIDAAISLRASTVRRGLAASAGAVVLGGSSDADAPPLSSVLKGESESGEGPVAGASWFVLPCSPLLPRLSAWPPASFGRCSGLFAASSLSPLTNARVRCTASRAVSRS